MASVFKRFGALLATGAVFVGMSIAIYSASTTSAACCGDGAIAAQGDAFHKLGEMVALGSGHRQGIGWPARIGPEREFLIWGPPSPHRNLPFWARPLILLARRPSPPPPSTFRA